MGKTMKVRNLILGEGMPKICVPITGSTIQELLEEIALAKAAQTDLVEWRVDYFNDALNVNAVVFAAKELREALGETPMLFTFRTVAEGGEKPAKLDAYVELNRVLAKSGYVDLVDVELSAGDGSALKKIVKAAHAHNVFVVASSHDFAQTPTHEEIVQRLTTMHTLGGDIPKIAVTPNDFLDVLTLMSATDEFSNAADVPVITMSMKWLGGLSRVAGEFYGSVLTFATVGRASAPGQLTLEEARTIMAILHARK
ncbi:type I 3-dehydroquinate dehydratase [Lachnospiraceae bacterium ZAX-1]